jgi:ribonuclease E
VKAYADPVPLFQRYGAEDQLTAMYDPVVQLKSGGYIVINPTEALVSIDINSGRSTKEHGIEATALNTNLEAAREIARQLRLRDMAGLVVIDFIDMEYSSNVRKVEKTMKDALKNDRARIQVGRISSFGLMEMSRQRLRTGVLEATTRGCPHCDGSGLVRTASSAGLSALRLIEDEAAKGRGVIITLFASTEASIYLLNAKRADLAEIEDRYGVRVEVIPEGENEGAKMRVGSAGPRNEFVPRFEPIVEEDFDDLPPEDELDEEEADEAAENGGNDGDANRKRRKRRRGRGRDRRDEQPATEGVGDSEEPEDGETESAEGDEVPEGAESVEASDDSEAPRKRRRRSRRRRGGRDRAEGSADVADEEAVAADGAVAEDVVAVEADPVGETAEPEAAPAPKKRTRRKKADASAPEPAADVTEAPDAAEAVVEVAAEAETEVSVETKPKRTRRKKVDAETAPVAEEAAEAPAANMPVAAAEEPSPKRTRSRRKKVEVEAEPAPEAETAPEPVLPGEPIAATIPADGDDMVDGEPRRGWWQRTFGN